MTDKRDPVRDPIGGVPMTHVSFGEVVPAITARASRLGELLERTDQRRGWVAIHLMTSGTALDALEELVALANGQVICADASDDQPLVRLFARRILNDIEDGIDALLELRTHGVLNACRDLMEVTVLVRDLRKSPQRLQKWLASDDDIRRREFGFGRLAHLYPKDEMPYMGPDIEKVRTEYTIHSRTLHPVPPGMGEVAELSHDSPADVLGAQWVHSWTYEILRHSMAALRQIMEWLIAVGKDVELPDDATPRDDSAIERHGAMNSKIHKTFPPEMVAQMAEWEESFRNKRPAAGASKSTLAE